MKKKLVISMMFIPADKQFRRVRPMSIKLFGAAAVEPKAQILEGDPDTLYREILDVVNKAIYGNDPFQSRVKESPEALAISAQTIADPDKDGEDFFKTLKEIDGLVDEANKPVEKNSRGIMSKIKGVFGK